MERLRELGYDNSMINKIPGNSPAEVTIATMVVADQQTETNSVAVATPQEKTEILLQITAHLGRGGYQMECLLTQRDMSNWIHMFTSAHHHPASFPGSHRLPHSQALIEAWE